MDAGDWTFAQKPYDLRKRLLNFACADHAAGAVPAHSGILMTAHDPVLAECAELVKIVATLLHRSRT